jgi:uncharacterized alpha-E superfamily protein
LGAGGLNALAGSLKIIKNNKWEEAKTMLSRVADNLYWMSRYLERAEHSARLLGVYVNATLEAGGNQAQRRERLLRSLDVDEAEAAALPCDEDGLLHAFTVDLSHPYSILSCIAASRENARQIREQISTEMWLHLNRFYLDSRALSFEAISDQPTAYFTQIKTGAHLFQGLTDATMNHNEGWHFIQVGRHLERALSVANLLDAHFSGATALMSAESYLQPRDYLDLLALLKSATAFEAYCKVYDADLRTDWIVEFLLLNPIFPHSVRFCVEGVVFSLEQIAESLGASKNSRLHRTVGRLRATLSYDDFSDIHVRLHAYLQDIRQQAATIHQALYNTYIDYALESAVG